MCLAFAVSDAHAAVRGAWSALSCEYLFFRAKQLDNDPPQLGTTVTSIRTALERDGQPVETAWPYLPVLPADLALWKPPTAVGALFCRSSLVKGSAFQVVWDEVEGGQPVVVGLTISSAFFLPDEQGVVDQNQPVDSALRHAVVAVATGSRGKRRFVLVRNSWGDTWGLFGYAWLSEAYAAPRIVVTVSLT